VQVPHNLGICGWSMLTLGRGMSEHLAVTQYSGLNPC
jgi:hypothetical protein